MVITSCPACSSTDLRCPRVWSVPLKGRRQCGACRIWIDVPAESCDAFLEVIVAVASLNACPSWLTVSDAVEDE